MAEPFSREKITQLSEKVYSLGPLGDPKILCSYLIKDEKVAIVDCGPSVVMDQLAALLKECDISAEEVDYLLLTHIHIDHAGGAAKFLGKFPNAIAFIPRRGYKHMIDPAILNASARAVLGDEIMNYWGDCEPVEEGRSHSVSELEAVKLGKSSIKYIPATGHAPHHNVLFDEDTRFLFAADSLGIFDDESGVQLPTTPPPSLDFTQSLKDVENVRKLKPELLCLSHFRVASPTAEFFDAVNSVYSNWALTIETYVSSKLSKQEDRTFGMANYQELFTTLENQYPKYKLLPDFLRKQSTRTDVAGLVDYFAKRQKTVAGR